MTQTNHNEADTRAKLITPALHKAGWTEDMIRREETAGTIEIRKGAPKSALKRTDYTLRIKISPQAQPVAVAVIEAKAEQHPPTHGLQQAKINASIKRLNVPFAFSSNGHLFVEYDDFTGQTSEALKMSNFPSPDELRQRYEAGKGFKFDADATKPLITPYSNGEGKRRYYQDAAIRAVLETIAAGEKRALLSLATGSGKTYIAVQLLKRIADAGNLRKVLFLCDRDELRNQALNAFQNEFGSDTAAASTNAPQKNARIIIATYQTLGVDTEDGNASFLTKHYPKNYFSHIIIDECHRSAWGKWSEVLKRNKDAIQIGLTATPRHFEYPEAEDNPEIQKDQQITTDNYKYFGEPIYEYGIGQGIEDGYLAAMQIIRTNTFINHNIAPEQETGLTQADLKGTEITDAITGALLQPEDLPENFSASSFEREILLPDRVKAWCNLLFQYIVAGGNPEQKTIIFCTSDNHADRVANELNNIYAKWCQKTKQTPKQDFAFKCTAASGKEFLADIRGSTTHHFIATTVDLLSTGVDVPPVVNIVFFKYVQSPIAFYQMIGRGTRLHPPSNKLMFRVYDFTNATRLFSAEMKAKMKPSTKTIERQSQDNSDDSQNVLVAEVHGLTVRVSHAGIDIITINDAGDTVPVTLEDYKDKLAQKLVAQAPTLDTFRDTWVVTDLRLKMLGLLPDNGKAPYVIQEITHMEDYDLYDILGEIGYGLAPKTKNDRAEAFEYKNHEWLSQMEADTANTIKAIASEFAIGGTDSLEDPNIFNTDKIQKAGGVAALSKYKQPPKEAYEETKQKMFTA